MGKFDGVLLCTDFDDTFCCPGQDIPPANLEAVEYFKSQGGRFTVVTGRAPHAFASVMPLVPVNAPVAPISMILLPGSRFFELPSPLWWRKTWKRSWKNSRPSAWKPTTRRRFTAGT